MAKTYAFDEINPIVTGDVDVPNFVALNSYGEFLNNLAAGGHMLLPIWGWAKLPGERKQWTQFFLTGAGMGSPRNGCFDGGGYMVTYDSRGPIIGTFAICRHVKKDAPGADHRRGWHPGACEKCGMDMTIDSGD